MTHTTFPVSCKAILYNKNGTKVLIVEYNPGNFGLPGGHIEGAEIPREAMYRELSEELGIQVVSLQQGSFTRHFDGKIVLFFYGNIDEATILKIDTNELGGVSWVSLDDIRTGEVDINVYRDDVLKHASSV